MSKLTFKRDIVVKWILLMLSAAFLAHGVGYVLDERAPETVQLEGNTKWCLHSEYKSVKEYKDIDGIGDRFVDIGQNKVRVFIECEGI